MRQLVLGLILAILITAASAECGEQKKWTLEELTTYALKHREDLLAQDERIKAAQSKVDGAFSHYLPRISIGAAAAKASQNYELDLSNSKITTSISTSVQTPYGSLPVNFPLNVALPNNVRLLSDAYVKASVTLDQPLYTWGRISHFLSAAQKSKEYETTKKREGDIDTVCQVRSAYYSFVVAQKAHQETEKIFQEVRFIRGLLPQLLQTGPNPQPTGLSNLDVMEVEEFFLQAQGMLIKTQEMQHTALSYLTLATGSPKDLSANGLEAVSNIDIELQKVDFYVNRALQRSPALESLAIGIQAEEHLNEAEKAARYPVLGVRAFYERLEDNANAYPRDYSAVCLVVSGPIFDSGEATAKADQHLHQAKEFAQKQVFLKKYTETVVTVVYEEITDLKRLLEIDSQKLKLVNQRMKLAMFALRNNMSPYQAYRDAFLMRRQTIQEHLERLWLFYEKVTSLLKLVGEGKI
ncbi:MAG: TolC family protein [Deltaproteobacteria bacterium]|nr:TolC family protein [Deltaproteobacteria bacterium]